MGIVFFQCYLIQTLLIIDKKKPAADTADGGFRRASRGG